MNHALRGKCDIRRTDAACMLGILKPALKAPHAHNEVACFNVLKDADFEKYLSNPARR